MILLETMAGQGSSIGSTFEELAEIRAPRIVDAGAHVLEKLRMAQLADPSHVVKEAQRQHITMQRNEAVRLRGFQAARR